MFVRPRRNHVLSKKPPCTQLKDKTTQASPHLDQTGSSWSLPYRSPPDPSLVPTRPSQGHRSVTHPYDPVEYGIVAAGPHYFEDTTAVDSFSSVPPSTPDPTSQPVRESFLSLDAFRITDQSWHSASRSINSYQDTETQHLERLISSKLDAVLTSIDGEAFSGDERELFIYPQPPNIRGGWGSATRSATRAADRGITSAVVSTNYFAKANLYANSRLPPGLPPLKLHLPSYPLICLAAQYSQRAYMKPSGKERDSHVDADWILGTKAMVIKSAPIDDMNVVVFAIRGSQTFMDWAVNLKSAPASPQGFLDDPGNLCHLGFLSVAQKMVQPVAARLRSLLEEDPSRSGCSLLITGHSAGGAIASLLYAHMLAEEARSELNILTGCFKRIHCLTFGAPPISLLPLSKPQRERHEKSLFLSFINEGDPVPRADKAYVRSLLDLYTSSSPPNPHPTTLTASPPCKITTALIPFGRPKPKRSNSAPAANPSVHQWKWPVPPGTLSNAGRLVALRATSPCSNSNEAAGAEDDVKAEVTSDQELREVVFGDPVMHMMKVYARRVEILATKAVTARIWG